MLTNFVNPKYNAENRFTIKCKRPLWPMEKFPLSIRECYLAYEIRINVYSHGWIDWLGISEQIEWMFLHQLFISSKLAIKRRAHMRALFARCWMFRSFSLRIFRNNNDWIRISNCWSDWSHCVYGKWIAGMTFGNSQSPNLIV